MGRTVQKASTFASNTIMPNRQKMSYHFASTDYTSCFQDLPVPDTKAIRTSALEYLDRFDPSLWYEDPIVSLLNGTPLGGIDEDGVVVTTSTDALGRENGKQLLASPKQVQQLIQHIQTYQSTHTDLRTPIRTIEQLLLTEYAGFLIGNQCLDFQKQDGVTEIEESVMANSVERRLNDLLLEDEKQKVVSVCRKPIYISCVSNFTNFLDLFRKTIRCLEVGIPCVVLGRSNTQQHAFRWTKLLVQLCNEHGIDPAMITFVSCSLEDIKTITQTCKGETGNLYSTCSRALAKTIKTDYPNTVASTGGPNTLIVLDDESKKSPDDLWTQAVQDAIRSSASIESSGQCTALRHCVIPPGIQDDQIQDIFASIKSIPDAHNALKGSIFDGIFENHKGSPEPAIQESYQKHPKADAFFKIASSSTESVLSNTSDAIEEYWRKVVVDVSRIPATKHIDELANWLNAQQPIALAINGSSKAQALDVGLELFSRTGMVVNTIGTSENPALTCQARPQEAEIFGEFPPRSSLKTYTKYPVVVPSSTPSYDTSYTAEYLKVQSQKSVSEGNPKIESLLQDVSDPFIRGYSVTLWEYLVDATIENPKRGFGTSRTAMWGLQRPPLGTTTFLRCNTTSSLPSWDPVVPMILLFHATNANDQLKVSIDPGCGTFGNLLAEKCREHSISYVMETDESFNGDTNIRGPGDNVVVIEGENDHGGDCPILTGTTFPMVGHFVGTLFPLGHIKSTQPNDEEFIARVRPLEKWLKTV